MSIILPPYVTTYATHPSYVTVSEFMSTPTGIDAMNLVPAGGTLTNTQALTNLLLRASGWADSLCAQKLAATLDTKAGKFPVRQGMIYIPLPYQPVVMVSSISMGYRPSSMAALTDVDMQDVWPDQNNVLTIPLPNLSISTNDRFYFGGRDVFATVTYVNGWANTGLTVAATAGATSLTVSSGLGIVAGQQLALYSQTAGEVVTVAPSYVASVATGTATVPLVSATLNAYAIGDILTAMPQEIKQAVICLACVLIKTRASDSMVMPAMHGNVSEKDKMEPGADTDFDTAMDLLAPYRRVA